MGIMPDQWIKKMVKERQMIDPFIDKLEKKVFCLMDYHLTVMMQESQKTLKFLQM